MSLTDKQVSQAKCTDSKPRKLADGKGLFLFVNQAGRYWRMDYRFGSKRKTLALGVYPDISLKAAREKCDAARAQIAAGTDPGEQRQAEKLARLTANDGSFEMVAREWFDKFSPGWTPHHAGKTRCWLERDAFPVIGRKPMTEITAPQLLALLRRIESRGTLETAHRVHQTISRVFRYGIATGRAERDPAADLRGALPPVREVHHASITDPKRIGDLLRAVDGYDGSPITKAGLQLAALLFVRPGELRKAEWAEFDLDKAEWRIPGPKMKMREQHIVPLARQAVAILRELHGLTGTGRFVFPGARTNGRPMSENTLNAALRRLDYKREDVTAHGFRSMASTLLNEQGWHRDAIERQLAHSERDGVRAAYNYAQYLPERKRMMQAWADYLDGLRTGADVIPLHRGKA